MAGREFTPEEHAAMKAEIEAAARRPYVYDPDCPLLTEKQLAEFRPVHFATMEERAKAMEEEGITELLWKKEMGTLTEEEAIALDELCEKTRIRYSSS
jgi:DNA-binding transcriptional regulator YhcF (GntR family)